MSWAALTLFLSMLGFADSPIGGEQNWGTKCLAAVGYAEARSESMLGEACVMRVVLNRATIEQAPICDVAQATSQFALPKSTAERQAWERSQWLAQFSIADAWPLPEYCYASTHFNQFYRKGALGRLGAHVFYP